MCKCILKYSGYCPEKRILQSSNKRWPSNGSFYQRYREKKLFCKDWHDGKSGWQRGRSIWEDQNYYHYELLLQAFYLHLLGKTSYQGNLQRFERHFIVLIWTCFIPQLAISLLSSFAISHQKVNTSFIFRYSCPLETTIFGNKMAGDKMLW